MTEAHNDMIVQASVPKTPTLKEIEGATDGDHTLRAFRAAIKLNKWHYDRVKSFKGFKDGLRVTPKGTTTSYWPSSYVTSWYHKDQSTGTRVSTK